MQHIEIYPDHYDRIALIAKATQLPFVDVLIALLEIADEIPMNYAEFEEQLRQLELDSKMLVADWREHNARIEVIAQMMLAGSIRQNTIEPIQEQCI
jgi:hypothetical protein